MVLGRRRKQENRDPFDHLADDRREAESGEPWFLTLDDGPELEVQAGISSNLRDQDIDDESVEGVGVDTADTDDG